MSKQLIVVAAAAAFILVLSTGTSHAQVETFGYPAGGAACGTGCGDASIAAQQRSFGYGQMSDRFKATQVQNEKIHARNAAWPKPFACASRQVYHNIWRPMYDAGYEDQNILTGVHFDQDGELTRYGKNQISGMMMNMPEARRTIYVQETADSAETNSRVAKVQDVIQTWYSQRGGMVRVSSRTAVTMSGVRAVDITDKATSSAPAPVIPIADGASGVSSAVSQ
ncbi:hypothetical protein [Mariniblastus fucicola]|uniref:Uncharacterized protein n=1 Tax=Mariniblastus fucicola TaxID=980251 RepID=A0A5B9PBT8_9BACT|nr:hypothetical protein [Mariniblastus fucicola]QEG22510.1 hypothetical protein MFFC18_23910 [Mariniblastus fucicola]